MTTAPQNALPEVGQRVVLAGDVDRFPHALLRQGAAGEVTLADDDQIHMLLDAHELGLAEWENRLIWYRQEHAGEGESLADAFWRQVEPEAPAPAP